jgi:hypothetical protein
VLLVGRSGLLAGPELHGPPGLAVERRAVRAGTTGGPGLGRAAAGARRRTTVAIEAGTVPVVAGPGPVAVERGAVAVRG